MTACILGLFTLLGLLAFVVRHYLRTARRKPELIFQANDRNQFIYQMLARLQRPYSPTPWMFNCHLQLLAMGIKQELAPQLKYELSEQLIMADGGTTALHWLGLTGADDMPTVLILHSIAGCPHNMRSTVRDLHALTGWRIALCQRRGHGSLPLTSPRINTLGDTDDLREQLHVIRKRLPNSPLYAIGVSAGSGLLVRYLGEEGSSTPLQAAMAYCPGYDINVAFARARPMYSRLMTKELIRHFVVRNTDMFAHLPTYLPCIQAKDLHSLHENMFEMAGYASRDEYFSDLNPVKALTELSIPLLILNAADDPVCVIQNIFEHEAAIRRQPNAFLVVTNRGSHCGFFEGWRARSWAHHLTAEFFQIMHARQIEKNHNG